MEYTPIDIKTKQPFFCIDAVDGDETLYVFSNELSNVKEAIPDIDIHTDKQIQRWVKVRRNIEKLQSEIDRYTETIEHLDTHRSTLLDKHYNLVNELNSMSYDFEE